MKLVDMLSLSFEEQNRILASERPTPKIRRFVGQSYTIVAYWRSGETKKFENLGKIVANRLVAQFRMEGAYRVDRIETDTMVNEEVGKNIETRTIRFGKQVFEAGEKRFVPNPIHREPEDQQLHILWPESPDIQDAYLHDKPVTKVAWRNAIQRSKDKQNARFQKLNPPITRDGWKAFDRKTGNFLFSSFDEMEVVKFFKNAKRTLEDTILYVPESVFQALREIEAKTMENEKPTCRCGQIHWNGTKHQFCLNCGGHNPNCPEIRPNGILSQIQLCKLRGPEYNIFRARGASKK